MDGYDKDIILFEHGTWTFFLTADKKDLRMMVGRFDQPDSTPAVFAKVCSVIPVGNVMYAMMQAGMDIKRAGDLLTGWESLNGMVSHFADWSFDEGYEPFLHVVKQAGEGRAVWAYRKWLIANDMATYDFAVIWLADMRREQRVLKQMREDSMKASAKALASEVAV